MKTPQFFAWPPLLIGALFAVAVPLPSALRAQDAESEAYLERKAKMLAQREALNESVWALETEAQRHEQTLVALWDALLNVDRTGKGDKLGVFSSLNFSSIVVGKPGAPEALPHGIVEQTVETADPLDRQGWQTWLQQVHAAGYRLIQSEWHHAKFIPQPDGPPRSEVSLVLHLIQESTQTRLAIDGVIKVQWSGKDDASGNPLPESVDASGLRMLSRQGKPAFEKWIVLDPSQPDKPAGIHPLLIYDLDGDGDSEVVAAGCNQVLELGEDGQSFQRRPFLEHWERFHEAGIIADVTGDGHVDFVAPNVKGDMVLYRGSEKGLYASRPLGKSKNGGPLQQPTALTAGDIDLDGDLDLWVGQYRISYVYGIMPSPYYDANDGFPAFLLLNEGGGKFVPHTEEAGLDKKAKRRTYTASFVDLDGDRDLDLLTVNDFAGIDVYLNDGKGKFTDVTESHVDERHLFGMSATFADYDGDGRLDFYVAGMGSTTARRLEHMKARRTDDPEVDEMRMTMAYGNRMYLNQGDGHYRQPEFKDRVARTGWTWGTTSLDFDNDGDVDIFVANGHSSGESTKDHCTHFWCHDIYNPLSQPDRAMHEVFQTVHQGYFDKSESWDGYQKSNLLMNLEGKDFTNVAFLMGVADEFDGRAALSEDIDRDGRVDLLVVEDRWRAGQILHVYRNVMETGNRWVGLTVMESPGRSPLGAVVTALLGNGKRAVKVVASGESIHGQHSSTVHFGLGSGSETKVEAIEVQWPDGHSRRLEAPELERYHLVRP